MTTLRFRTSALAVVLSAALLSGCGKKTLSPSKTYPVKGKIMYKGEPARFVFVRFSPTDGKGAEGSARTDEHGEFELRTFSNTDENDGGVPGEYAVVIEGFDPARRGPKLPQGAKPTALEGEVKAPDTYEIKAENNELTIEIP